MVAVWSPLESVCLAQKKTKWAIEPECEPARMLVVAHSPRVPLTQTHTHTRRHSHKPPAPLFGYSGNVVTPTKEVTACSVMCADVHVCVVQLIS